MTRPTPNDQASVPPLPQQTQRHRVLLVSSSSGSQGGGELYLEGLAEGLAALGHQVSSLLAVHPRMDDLAGRLARFGKVARENFPNTYDRRTRSLGAVLARRTIRRLSDRIAALRPDVIHLNKQNLEDGLDLLLAAERTELPTVCTIHVTRRMAGLGSYLGGVRDWVARQVLRQSRCEYLAVARAGSEPLIQFLGGNSASRVHTIWNGIREAPSVKRQPVRADWGVGDDDVVIGTVARLEKEKNPLFALRLLTRLPERVRLVWVGDGRERSAFEQTAAQLGVAHRVHLDGWRTDARSRMTGFDIFILPSLYEFFPFAVLEAMSAGLPCITSAVGGIGEAVLNGKTGWLCTPDDETAWHAKLIEMIDTPDERHRIGDAGRQRVALHFSLEAMARGTVAVYEAAIRRKAGAGAA